MVAYLHIEYPTCQFSGELEVVKSLLPPDLYGIENSLVLRGLSECFTLNLPNFTFKIILLVFYN